MPQVSSRIGLISWSYHPHGLRSYRFNLQWSKICKPESTEFRDKVFSLVPGTSSPACIVEQTMLYRFIWMPKLSAILLFKIICSEYFGTDILIYFSLDLVVEISLACEFCSFGYDLIAMSIYRVDPHIIK